MCHFDKTETKQDKTENPPPLGPFDQKKKKFQSQRKGNFPVKPLNPCQLRINYVVYSRNSTSVKS